MKNFGVKFCFEFLYVFLDDKGQYFSVLNKINFNTIKCLNLLYISFI